MLAALINGITILFILASSEALAVEKATIRWLAWEQPPNFITKGPFLGQGIGDSFTKSLQDRLPQYNHETVITNARRYNLLIREDDVCAAWAWIIPGSHEYRVHSRPVSLVPPSGILTLKSKQHLFGKPGDVLSLEELLKNSELVLGYLEDMAYSKRVNELLEQYRGKQNVHFSSRSNVDFSLVMLDTNRLDYFFAFSNQPIFDAAVKGIENKYQFYNVKEIEMYSSMHSNCSKTPFGEKVMEDINKVLTKDLLMEQLSKVELWYGKSETYRDIFMDYVIHQNKNKLVTHPGQ
jgi:uncharacterized protein (TIGR02285 family)